MVSIVENSANILAVKLAEKEELLRKKEEENVNLRNRIRLLEKALFGPRSERVIDLPENQQQFDDLLAEVQSLSDALSEQESSLNSQVSKEQKKQPRKRRNLEEIIPSDFPREEILLDIPESDRICLETGEPLTKIGEERSEKLAYKPGSYYVKVFVRPKYASKTDSSQGILSRTMPNSAIPRSHFDESFLAGVVVEKCAYHLPLYRQAERLSHQSIDVGRQSLSRLYIQTAKVLEPLYELMKEEILKRGVLFTDDTPIKMQVKGRGKTITGRMWVYIGGGPGPPYRLFDFTIDRCKTRPKAFLNGYRGYIHADAYKGYDDLFCQEGVYECACWMHVRRKYVEAEDGPISLRQEILCKIRGIYRYERLIRGRADEEILKVRKQRIAPLIDQLFNRTARALTDQEVLPRSSLANAIGYMHNLGSALKTFINDPRLKPDNGLSERAIRPLTIGRKNWLFAGSKSGGDATGILMSIIQSCRVLDIDPFAYLDDVLRRINGHTYNKLSQLLPHNWKPVPNHYT